MRGEDNLQASIVRFLKIALPADSYFCAIPNGSVLAGDAKKRGMQMNRLKTTGLRVGAPDLFILARGVFLALEVKTPKGKLADSQKAASDEIIHAGGLWAVVRSVEEVERFLRDSGIVLHATVLKEAA